MEPISEAIACDSSMRFSEGTSIRMMTRIIKILIANGLPINKKARSLEISIDNKGLD
jgi:hypothetical protein